MLKEGETLITRPILFKNGCPTCPVANKFIRMALDGNIPKPWINLEIKSVVIECTIQEKVNLLLKYNFMIRFVINGPLLEVEGGNVNPEPVECPYFKG